MYTLDYTNYMFQSVNKHRYIVVVPTATLSLGSPRTIRLYQTLAGRRQCTQTSETENSRSIKICVLDSCNSSKSIPVSMLGFIGVSE